MKTIILLTIIYCTVSHAADFKDAENASSFYNRGMHYLYENKDDLAKEELKKSAEMNHCLAQAEYASFFEGKEKINWILKSAYNGNHDSKEFLKGVNPQIMKQNNPQEALDLIYSNRNSKSFFDWSVPHTEAFFKEVNK